MVSNYNNNECRYTFGKLKDVIYLFDENHTKLMMDGEECRIQELSQTPMQLNVRDVDLSEATSLDERYQFDKTLKFVLDGFNDQTVFEQKYFAIIENVEGTRWVVNPDFPVFVTYTFTLSADRYQTEHTMHTLGNFPVMRLVSDFEYDEAECRAYNVKGIETLDVIERGLCDIDRVGKKLYTYADMSRVIPNKDSIVLTQTFDGRNIEDIIEFTIPFDEYKYGWHYSLLQFPLNRYAAVITPKSMLNKFYVGFNQGLQAGYSLAKDGDVQTITVRLSEMSNIGLAEAVDYATEAMGTPKWVYVARVNGNDAYECSGAGTALYLVQEEQYGNGTKTGRYKVKEGYESMFPNLNIVGTFSGDVTFSCADCVGIPPYLEGFPASITFRSATSYTYYISSNCEWEITDIPEGITLSRTSGSGDTAITVSCNTLPEDGGSWIMSMEVGGLYVKPITVNIEGINDKRVKSTGVDCLAQDVVFNLDYGYDCQIITPVQGALYTRKENGTIIVGLSKNETSSAKRYTLNLQDVNGTYSVTINQTRMFSDTVANGTVCENGNLYEAMELYTGATPTNLYPTGSVSAGTLVEENALQCSDVMTRWTSGTGTVCLSGNEWSTIEEQQSTDGGTTWSATGVIQLGKIIIEGSPICAQPVTEYWLLTDEYICDDVLNE